MTTRSRGRLVAMLALVFVAAVAGGVALGWRGQPSTDSLGGVTRSNDEATGSANAGSPVVRVPPAGVAMPPGGLGASGPPAPRGISAACASAHKPSTAMTRTVPVLMYHQVGNPRPWSRWPGLFVRTSDFAAQLHALLAHGWTAITAATLGHAMDTGHAVPAKSFVITIDDGELSSWTNAFPVLQRDCLRATYYVPAAFVGTPGHITERDLAAIARAGDEIGNHSMNHINLGSRRLTAAMLLVQTVRAAARLHADLAAQGVHVAITTFAYPYGRYAAPVVGLLSQLGYTLAVTTAHGYASIGSPQPLLTPRIRVSRGETAGQLLAQMP
jgi:peptidoglycan/xylan/chitin deacetylase (PgdA/CDA1 family)